MAESGAAWRFEQARRLFSIVARRPIVGPLRVSLEVTHHCNLRCSFCESHGSLRGEPITARREYAGGRRTMSLDSVAALARSLARVGVGRVELSGKGDPIAHPELAEIVRIIKGAGLRCCLVTNGTLAKPDLAATLVDSKLDRLNVSLNAGSRESFERIAGKDLWDAATGFLREVVERRRAAGARRPWVQASFVLCRDNIESAEGMVDLCCELGLDKSNWTVMGELPETRHLQLSEEQVAEVLASIPEWIRRLEEAGVGHDLPRLAAALPVRVGGSEPQENPLQRSLPCYEGWMFTVIGPDGTVAPCCACENVRLGNVEEEDFCDLWRGKRYQDFRGRSLDMPRTGKPICWECFTVCGHAAENQRIHRLLGPLRPR